ncbi:MAG: hypothetical protein KF772_01825 [Cryobacterium sp.]|nr:hypothetical protein [Cryobacterium sp.]
MARLVFGVEGTLAAGLAGGLGPEDLELLDFELLVAGFGEVAFAAGVLAGLGVVAGADAAVVVEAAAGVADAGAGWAGTGAALVLAAGAAGATGAGGRC